MLRKNQLATFSALFCLFLISAPQTAQSQTKLWAQDMTASLAQVGWITQSNDGIIIAAGNTAMMGMDNTTGKQIWMNADLHSVQKDSYQNIEGLPLFYAEYVPIAGKTRGIIMHSSTGKVLYDTKDDNYRIKDYHLLPKQGMILFEMTRENTRYLMSFSLKTMTKSWVVDLGEIKGMVAQLGNSTSRVSFINHGPMFSKGGELIVGLNEMAYGINATTGQLLWSYEAEKNLKALVYSPESNSVYMGVKKSNKLIVLDPANGKDITPGKLKLRGSLLDITSDDKGHIVLVETEGFNLIDPATSDFIWEKSYKIPYLDQVLSFNNGYVAIAKDEKEGSISYVDTKGKKIWDTKVNGYVYYATTSAKGVLYISTERSNILSYSDGKDVWDKDVKFKSIPAVTFDESEKKVVLYESGTGYKFDPASGLMTIFAEDIKLDNITRKSPLEAEYRPSGYILYTDQHLSLLSPKGKLVYTQDFPPLTSTNFTGLAQFGADMAGVDIDIAGAIENIKELELLTKGGTYSSNAVNDGTSDTYTVATAYFYGDQLFEVTKTRYFNSRNLKDHKFIATKDAESNRSIVMVNKDTGKVDKKIMLTESTPQYVVDGVENRVYVCEKNTMITCYDMD